MTAVPARGRPVSARMPARLSRVLTIVRWPAAQLGLVLVIGAVWEWAANAGVVDEFFVGKPTEILVSLVHMSSTGELYAAASSTLIATALAFVIGTGLGIPAAVLLTAYPAVLRLLQPFIHGFNSMPRVALAPLFILWFGIGIAGKMVAGVSLVFFIVLITTMGALKIAERDYIELARSLGFGKAALYRKVLLPNAVPSTVAGLRLGIIYALLGVVASEMIASAGGLGQGIARATNTFDISSVYAILLVLMLIALALTALTNAVERRLLRWAQPRNGQAVSSIGV